MTIRRIALVSKDSAITSAELMDVAAALQKQVTDDFGPIWSIQATVSAFDKIDHVPLGYWPIVIQDKIGQKGAGGFHDKKRQPFAKVLYDPKTPVWTVAASHELLEMLADPSGNHVVAAPSLRPDQGTVEYIMEVCDPCESMDCAYTVNGVMLSDFYTPSFFNRSPSTGVQYDFTGHLIRPLQVIEGGYISWYDPISQSIWQQFVYEGKTFYKQNGQLVDDRAPARQTDVLELLDDKTLREYVDSITPNPLYKQMQNPKPDHVKKLTDEREHIMRARKANALQFINQL
jgi:hypothetical protein